MARARRRSSSKSAVAERPFEPATPRHLTAIGRIELSRPIRFALEDGVVTQTTTLLDFGCGRGGDVTRLVGAGVRATGWDPVHLPSGSKNAADVVNLGYVVNVIERPSERVDVLREAWSLARSVLLVSVRLKGEARDEEGLRTYEDGCLTRLGTFQKFFEQSELRDWVEAVLATPVVVAGPGILYVFRDERVRESFLAARQRRRVATPRLRQSDVIFEKHRRLFESLMEFVAERGRLPVETELECHNAICMAVGTIKRAFRVVRRVTGDDQWDRIRDERSQDLQVYIALARFGRRPPFGKLPQDLQLDVRAFFSTYTRACSVADLMLFSAGVPERREDAFKAARVGKLMPTALYVHTSAVSRLPPVLRIYEGCARSYVGRVDRANIVKLHRDQPRVSYLSYPAFETEAHPELASSLSVHLQSFALDQRSYQDQAGRPILHRKEDFVTDDHPLRERFERLTRQEERRGLYDEPARIGTSSAWTELLAQHDLMIRGHRLLRAKRSK
ncbi:MAG TPA: DNA phosphorothioation-associated putative methyltransferase [Planctomycetota bacterium]|nr:DNA phosphorothioation-associated putative methyltransferase [Planctomycetota bacterium]